MVNEICFKLYYGIIVFLYDLKLINIDLKFIVRVFYGSIDCSFLRIRVFTFAVNRWLSRIYLYCVYFGFVLY